MTVAVLMVGCGNMGSALIARWAELSDFAFTVLDPACPSLPSPVTVVGDVSAVGDQTFDAMIVAVKPQMIDTVIPPVARHLSDGGFVISIAAGTSAEAVSTACGGAGVVRLMPNMPARVGRGVSGLYAQDNVSHAQRAVATTLANAVGQSIWVEAEDAIDRITAAAGSGPGYVFEFARTYQSAVEAQGFSPEDARQIVVDTVLGSMMLATEDAASFEGLRNSITSQGGTTAAGLAALNSDGELDTRLSAALQAAYARAVELRR